MRQRAPRVSASATNGVKMKKLGVFLASRPSASAIWPTRPTCCQPPRPRLRRPLPTALRAFGPGSNSTPADCPLSWGPFTAYATLDWASPTSSNGAPYNAAWNNGVNSFIQKQSYGPKWLWSPNNLSQSVAGIKMSQPIGGRLVGYRHLGMGIQSVLRATPPPLSSRWCRTTARRCSSKARTPTRAAPANRTTRKRS